MRYTYNSLTFEEIGKELVLELSKITPTALRKLQGERQEAIQSMPPIARCFCSQLMDIMIDIKETGQLQKDVAALDYACWVSADTPLGSTLLTIAKGDPKTMESVMDSYNLGKIHGIRQERARRRK